MLPGVFRQLQLENGSYITEFSQKEYAILADFISEACGIIKDIHTQETVAWLEVAQHFGVPTRLLDFTKNPLVALYFACIGSPNQDASVWILNMAAYNRVFYMEKYQINPAVSDFRVHKIVSDEIINQDFSSHIEPTVYFQFPWIYKPFYRNERMISQSSMFMLWAAGRADLTTYMQPNYYMTDDIYINNQETGILYPIIVPKARKQELLNQLNICGINEKFIYPGLEGIGRYIRKKHSIM